MTEGTTTPELDYDLLTAEIRASYTEQFDRIAKLVGTYDHKGLDINPLPLRAMYVDPKVETEFINFIHRCLLKMDKTQDINFTIEIYADNIDGWNRETEYSLTCLRTGESTTILYDNTYLDIQDMLKGWLCGYLSNLWFRYYIVFQRDAEDYKMMIDDVGSNAMGIPGRDYMVLQSRGFHDYMVLRLCGFKTNDDKLEYRLISSSDSESDDT